MAGSAYHGRLRRALTVFRLAPESFGSAQRWTHERVSATGGPARLWGCLGCSRPPSGELPSSRCLSPVALSVPAPPGSPTDPSRDRAQRPWEVPEAGDTDPGTQAASGDHLERPPKTPNGRGAAEEPTLWGVSEPAGMF